MLGQFHCFHTIRGQEPGFVAEMSVLLQILGCGAEKFLRLVIEVPNHTMTTLLPPPSKKAKLASSSENQIVLSTVTGNVLVQFKASDTGEITGTTVRIPAPTTARELELLLNQLLNTVDKLPANLSNRLD
jgi:hypothetical protein